MMSMNERELGRFTLGRENAFQSELRREGWMNTFAAPGERTPSPNCRLSTGRDAKRIPTSLNERTEQRSK